MTAQALAVLIALRAEYDAVIAEYGSDHAEEVIAGRMLDAAMRAAGACFDLDGEIVEVAS